MKIQKEIDGDEMKRKELEVLEKRCELAAEEYRSEFEYTNDRAMVEELSSGAPGYALAAMSETRIMKRKPVGIISLNVISSQAKPPGLCQAWVSRFDKYL